jgi:UDP:flavonoid glycosyltransferase YjiC (YdhE family)
MRVLCTTIPARGHFFPIVPLAIAAIGAGHTVAVATASNFHSEVRHAGLTALSAGASIEEMRSVLKKRDPRDGKRPPGPAAAYIFSVVAPQAMLVDLVPLSKQWQPDVVMHEEGEYAGPLAASLLGRPSVCVTWPAPSRSVSELRRLEGMLAPLWRRWGSPVQRFGGVFAQMVLDCCPGSLQTSSPTNARQCALRPGLYDGASAQTSASSEWRRQLRERPTVYVTMGTVGDYNGSPEIFRSILEGIHGCGLQAIVTVGENNDPAVFGATVEGVFLRRYVPQSVVLPHCSAVICHAGAGSAIGALAHGLPMLLIPRGGASQQRMGAACARAGAGRLLPDSQVSPEAVQRELGELLGNPTYRAAAKRVAEEIQSMPAAYDRIRDIESCIRSGRATRAPSSR